MRFYREQETTPERTHRQQLHAEEQRRYRQRLRDSNDTANNGDRCVVQSSLYI